MKKFVVLSFALMIGVCSFAQKKELKLVEKAIELIREDLYPRSRRSRQNEIQRAIEILCRRKKTEKGKA